MANNAEYNDKQNVAAALVEYRELEFGRNYSIAGKNGYIGNLSQVYDNVNSHESRPKRPCVMCLPSLVYFSKHRISVWALSGKSSGITMPNEITYFNASSTLISSSRTSLFFTMM